MKGEKGSDSVSFLRDPMETRPLCMKNCFNNLIMAANCSAMNAEYFKITHKTQNGFTGGRIFFNNLVALDSAGRMYSCAYEGSKKPDFNLSIILISAAFDFEAAFPSVIHAWIWVVFRHRKLPEHFLHFFKANYDDAMAVFVHNGIVANLLHFLSGVLQGCPGSAMMFNNAQDPFLARFHNALREKHSGIIRACADDIGITLTQLRHLRIVHPIFGECKAHGGLNVKPPKCCVVPLCKWSE